MPNIKSAEKRVLVSTTKKLQNQKIRSQMLTAIKKFNAAISEGNVELARTLLPIASSKIDNAAVKKVIHKNAANRKKAQLAKALSQLERGIVVVKVDAKTLKQQEQRAAAAKKAAEAEAVRTQRNTAKKAKEAAKQPATPAKKGKKPATKAPKATATTETPAEKPAPKKRATKKPSAPVAETPVEVDDGDEIK